MTEVVQRISKEIILTVIRAMVQRKDDVNGPDALYPKNPFLHSREYGWHKARDGLASCSKALVDLGRVVGTVTPQSALMRNSAKHR